jgi:hypothetical protein
MPPLRRRSAALAAAAAALLLVAALASVASANAQAAPSPGTPAPGSAPAAAAQGGRAKGGSKGGGNCAATTGVAGCVTCVAGRKGSARRGSHSGSSSSICTACGGDGYLAKKPVAGVCQCAGGYGRSGGGAGAACTTCTGGSVAAPGAGVCTSCDSGYEPILPQRVSCAPLCSPLTQADCNGRCGAISDGCSGTVDCGGCPGTTKCDPSTNQCGCPAGFADFGGNDVCVALALSACSQGSDCASLACNGGSCVETCPPLSEPTSPLVSGGGCVCLAGSFSTNTAKSGKAPCVACGGGSYQPKKGQAECVCESPRVWERASNTCVCPVGFLWTNGACLPTGGAGSATVKCSVNADCTSAECTNDKKCSTRSCPDGSAPLGTVGCLCPPGKWSATGVVPCQACPSGASSSASYGSTSCVCTSPTGSVWSPDANTCSCLAPTTVTGDGTACRLRSGEPCQSGATCASGTCSAGVCASKCGINAKRNAVTGNCVCNSGAWGPGGVEPCKLCIEGSTTGGKTAQSACTCPAGRGTWSPATGGCECPAGQEHSKTTGLCLRAGLSACTSGTQCASGVCATGLCASQCPIGSQANAKGDCVCLPNSFGPAGAPGSNGCTPCGGGSYAPLGGSSACICSSPKGSLWVPQDNACECPSGLVLVPELKACLTPLGGTCAAGSKCASGVCGPLGTCITAAACTAENGSVVNGSCRCNAGYYGAGGVPSCNPCPTGSSSTGTGNAVCTCDDAATTGQTWNVVSFLFAWFFLGGPLSSLSPSLFSLSLSLSLSLCVSLSHTHTHTHTHSKHTHNNNNHNNPPRSQDLQACVCPDGQAPAANDVCLNIDGNVCSAASDCLSNFCDPQTSTCSYGCLAANTVCDPVTNTCKCKRNYYLNPVTNECTACTAGSSSSGLGATECTCWSPAFSVFNPVDNTCDCPPLHQLEPSFNLCKTDDGVICNTGLTCLSGLCQDKKCVSQCAPTTVPDGAGGCICDRNYFGPDGRLPCTACGVGSQSLPNSVACTCTGTGATWSLTTNTCTCPPGEVYGSGGCQCDPNVCSTACLSAANPQCANNSLACVAGTCVPATAGAKCYTSLNRCGACVASCTANANDVCQVYGTVPCRVEGFGGEGRCGPGLVCCALVSPYYITPRRDGSC